MASVVSRMSSRMDGTRRWGQPRNHQDVPQDALDDVDVEAVAQRVSLAPGDLRRAHSLLGTGV
eukprot:1366717-Heterocapsa_arctica.AAC.1